MNGIPRNVSNKERATHDVGIMIAATDLKPDGSPQYKSFSSIQRRIHADDIAGMHPSNVDLKLMGMRYTDTLSLARAVGAFYDPRAFTGYDYRDVPDYERMVKQLADKPKLASMSPNELYDFTLRRNQWPKGADSILAIANQIYTGRRAVIINPRSEDSNSHEQTTLSEPDPKRIKYSTVTQLFTPTIATDLASRFLETLKPSKYELEKKELIVAQALTKIVEVKGVEPDDTASHVYQFSPASLTETLLINDPTASRAQIRELVGLSSLRVSEKYGIAAALVMKRGSLPEGSPNMKSYLDYLNNYSVKTSRGVIFPYRGISAGCLGSVFARLTLAEELIKLDILRTEPNPLRQLGEALEARKERLHSSS